MNLNLKILTGIVVGCSFSYASTITALTDATVKLIGNQNQIQKKINALNLQNNNLKKKIHSNTLIIKYNNDRIANTQKQLTKILKAANNSNNDINNLKTAQSTQATEIQKLLKKENDIQSQLTNLQNQMKQQNLLYKNTITSLKQEYTNKIDNLKKTLIQQMNAKSVAQSKTFNEKLNQLNIKITKAQKQILNNNLLINSLTAQHNTDIALLRKEMNTKIANMNKTLKEEMNILSIRKKGIISIVEVPAPPKPVFVPNKKKDTKVKKANTIINNFLQGSNSVKSSVKCPKPVIECKYDKNKKNVKLKKSPEIINEVLH